MSDPISEALAAAPTANPIDDSLAARISTACSSPTREILHHAWVHDKSGLRELLKEPGSASCMDPSTRETPLHAAIRACGPADPEDTGSDGEDGCVEEARDVMQELFFCGAIWNDLDDNDETPGCVALRLGRRGLYEMCVDAGVRAEMLLSLFDNDGYEELDSEDEDAEMNGDDGTAIVEPTEAQDGTESSDKALEQEGNPASVAQASAPTEPDRDVNSEDYLKAQVTYSDGKLVDDGGNGVMMAWETEIMRRSVDALLPDLPAGARILNIGFGMGIVDGMFAATKPSRHHVIEAHEAVLAYAASKNADGSPACAFGPEWEASGPEEGAFKMYAGKWQGILPELLVTGEQYDAIYFDTFGEDYTQLKLFFTEFVPALLAEGGRFSFFNGLGADRRVCYDVYTKVVEMHTTEAAMDIEWIEIPVDMKGMEEAGKGEWEGVRRRYWTLDTYRLPICTMLS
ncbi:Arginine N-methyltransferase 2 [Ceratocystis pirilliformis]|uniref:Arginine N-methyltransferase 2 n=1 Tax=Ceratocystis pirilliformis TaxID=259994 RepID=A0ABR3Z9L1_9PEZI